MFIYFLLFDFNFNFNFSMLLIVYWYVICALLFEVVFKVLI